MSPVAAYDQHQTGPVFWRPVLSSYLSREAQMCSPSAEWLNLGSQALTDIADRDAA